METPASSVELLNEAETNAAREILRQKPELAKALTEYHSVYANALGKLRTVMVELRRASLNPREQKLVLLGAQFNEQRASEIQRVVNDTDENFERFLKGEIGFRIALAQARAALPASTIKAHPKLEEFARNFVNAFHGPWPKKKVAVEVERLECRVCIIFKPIKGKKPATSGKSSATSPKPRKSKGKAAKVQPELALQAK